MFISTASLRHVVSPALQRLQYVTPEAGEEARRHEAKLEKNLGRRYDTVQWPPKAKSDSCTKRPVGKF